MNKHFPYNVCDILELPLIMSCVNCIIRDSILICLNATTQENEHPSAQGPFIYRRPPNESRWKSDPVPNRAVQVLPGNSCHARGSPGRSQGTVPEAQTSLGLVLPGSGSFCHVLVYIFPLHSLKTSFNCLKNNFWRVCCSALFNLVQSKD